MSETNGVMHHRRSDSLKELLPAMNKMQAAIKNAPKDSANPFFKSKYADLATIWDTIRAPLTANGLLIVQEPFASENGAGVVTTLFHTSDEWMESTLILPAAKADAQGVGSAITYARRYALQAIAGVSPEDDDGNAAAASVAKGRDKALAMLKDTAAKGLPALEAAWKSLDNETRKLCQADLPALKETANAALSA